MPVPSGTVRIVNVGGIAGWQVTVIALIAALIAAAAAVAINHALAARRRALLTGISPCMPASRRVIAQTSGPLTVNRVGDFRPTEVSARAWQI
jgi:hypothetical protein